MYPSASITRMGSPSVIPMLAMRRDVTGRRPGTSGRSRNSMVQGWAEKSMAGVGVPFAVLGAEVLFVLFAVPPSDIEFPMAVSSAVARAELGAELPSTGTFPTSCR